MIQPNHLYQTPQDLVSLIASYVYSPQDDVKPTEDKPLKGYSVLEVAQAIEFFSALALAHNCSSDKWKLKKTFLELQNEQGRTALILAAESDLHIVRLLIDHGVNLDQRDSAGNSALHRAALKGHRTMCELLMKAMQSQPIKIDVGIQNKDGCTALHFAARATHPELVGDFIAQGLDIDAVNTNNSTPLHFAAKGCMHSFDSGKKTISVLLTHGAQTDIKDKQNFTFFEGYTQIKYNHEMNIKMQKIKELKQATAEKHRKFQSASKEIDQRKALLQNCDFASFKARLNITTEFNLQGQ